MRTRSARYLYLFVLRHIFTVGYRRHVGSAWSTAAFIIMDQQNVEKINHILDAEIEIREV